MLRWENEEGAANGDQPPQTARALRGRCAVGLAVLKWGESWAPWDKLVIPGKSQIIPGEETRRESLGWPLDVIGEPGCVLSRQILKAVLRGD